MKPDMGILRHTISGFIYALFCVAGLLLLPGCASTTNSNKSCPYSKEEITTIKQQAESGDAELQLKLAGIYIAGICLTKDVLRIQELTHKAAEQGNATAQSNLGRLYASGELGFEQDLEQAVLWYTKAADQGDLQAQKTLGKAYYYGSLDVEADLVEAVYWFRKAAKQGDVDAQRSLGGIYRYGEDIKDTNEALKWYSLAAEQGDFQSKKAVDNLSKQLDPVGWQKKLDKERELLESAAEIGDVSAAHTLGNIYMGSDGVERDFDEGVKWYKKAAEGGNVEAALELGEIYNVGKEVERDIDEAIKWYTLAAKNGDIMGKLNLDTILQERDPVAWEKQTCRVEGDGSNEKAVFESFTPEAYGVKGPEPRIDENYPEYWPRRGKIDDIAHSIQGKYWCVGERGSFGKVIFAGELDAPCSFLEINKLNDKELEIKAFGDDKKVMHKKVLEKGEDYALKKYAIKMKLKPPKKDESSKKIPELTTYLTLTTNNCLVAKYTVEDWKWNPEGVAYGAMVMGPVALILLAPNQVGKSQWSLTERIEE